jgi:hypothetical protein
MTGVFRAQSLLLCVSEKVQVQHKRLLSAFGTRKHTVHTGGLLHMLTPYPL